MPTLYNTVSSTSVLTAFGGAFLDADTIWFQEGTDVYSADLNQTAIDFTAIYASAAYRGNLGGASLGAFTCDVDQVATGKVVLNFGGREWYHNGGTGGTVNLYEINPVLADAQVVLNSMTLTKARVMNGAVRMLSDCDVATAYFTGGDSLIDESGANTFTLVDVSGNARLRLKRDGTTLRCGGNGRLTVDDFDCAPTTLEVRGGYVDWGGGDIGTFNAYGGTIDFRNAPRDISPTGGTIAAGARIIVPASGVDVDLSACTVEGENLIVEYSTGPGGGPV